MIGFSTYIHAHERDFSNIALFSRPIIWSACAVRLTWTRITRHAEISINVSDAVHAPTADVTKFILRRLIFFRVFRRICGSASRTGSDLFRRFAIRRSGSTAVEFAILAVPFLSLLCVVAEAGVVALEQQTLDLAVDRGVRQLRTGVFQDSAYGSDPSQRFRRIVCSGPSVLFPCTDLRVDVSRATSFSAFQPAEPFDKTNKTWVLGFGMRFDCPQGGDTVTVRVAVPVMRLFRILDFTGRIMSNNSQMLIATAVFRAESYERKPC